MGTSFAVTVPGASQLDRHAIEEAVAAELTRVDRLMSTYRADSEVSRLNRSRSLDPFPVSEPTFAVLDAAREVGATTAGAFDVTVGGLVGAWGFGADAAARPPSQEAVERLLASSGWSNLTLDSNGRYVTKRAVDLQVDLSAIAKGYAVDRVGKALLVLGHADHLVDVGGDLLARGRGPEGRAWRVGVERPDPLGRMVHRIVSVNDTAVATSGDYRNFREAAGRRYGHILDPRTGRPAGSRVASATVLHRSAMLADAFATALLVLGEEDGMALAEREGLAALLILRDDGEGLSEAVTSAFRARMEAQWN